MRPLPPLWLLCATLSAAGLVPPAAAQEEDSATPPTVILYAERDFGGQEVTVAYPANFPDLQGADTGWRFGRARFQQDIASSIRWLIPRGCIATVFEDPHYKGRRITLEGTGRWEKLPNLGKLQLDNRLSSLLWRYCPSDAVESMQPSG